MQLQCKNTTVFALIINRIIIPTFLTTGNDLIWITANYTLTQEIQSFQLLEKI